jgi:TetR/AcrR family transcriptional repressor of nem operon
MKTLRPVNNYLLIDKIFMTPIDTKQKILMTARKMVQSRGYQALSFREIGKAVGVKSASIHYHFPTKGDLGSALAREYTEELVGYLEKQLASSEDQKKFFRSYTDVFRNTLLNQNRMCLCGIMAAERDELPAEVRSEVEKFNQANVRFLSTALALGPSGSSAKNNQKRALTIFAGIEGAQLVARGSGDVKVFDDIVDFYRTTGLLP